MQSLHSVFPAHSAELLLPGEKVGGYLEMNVEPVLVSKEVPKPRCLTGFCPAQHCQWQSVLVWTKKYVVTVLDRIVSLKKYPLGTSECDLIWNDLCKCSEGKKLEGRPSWIRPLIPQKEPLYKTERGRQRHSGEGLVTTEAGNGDHIAPSQKTSGMARSH